MKNSREILVSAEGVRLDRAPSTLCAPLTFEVGRSEALVIMGGNGSGKTSFLKVLAGLEPPQAGRIVTNGTVAFVPQRQALFATLKIADHLSLTGQRHRLDEFLALLERLMPPPRPDRVAGSFSGGEQRLIALAIAVFQAPDILLMDEPLAPLRAAAANKVIALVGSHLEEHRGCAVIAEHRTDVELPSWPVLRLGE